MPFDLNLILHDYGLQGLLLIGAMYASHWLAREVVKPITESLVTLLKVMVTGEIEDARVKVKIESDLHAIREFAEQIKTRQEEHIQICEADHG